MIDPDEARPGVPVLADAELREGRHVPARPAAVRRSQLPGQLRDAEKQPIAKSIKAFAAGAYTDVAGLLAAHLLATTPSSSTELTEAIEAADPRSGLSARAGPPRPWRRVERAARREPSRAERPRGAARRRAGRARRRRSLVVCFLSITLGSRVDHARDGLGRAHRLRPGLGVGDRRARDARAAHAARHHRRRRARAQRRRSSRASPATRSPTPGSWASTPARPRSSSSASWCSASQQLGSYIWLAFARRGARDGAGLRRRLVRAGGRDAGQARARRRRGDRRADLDDDGDRPDRRRRAQRAALLAGRLARPAATRRSSGRPRRSSSSAPSSRSPCGRALNGLALGEDVARALGQRVRLTRAVMFATVAVLCGAATAACGPIVFLGPRRAARRAADLRPRLPLDPAVLAGARAGRPAARRHRRAGVVLAPGELQVGVVLGVLGAPVFIALVRYRNLAEL